MPRPLTTTILLGTTLVMNLLDVVLTLAVVTAGLAVEANPLMAALLDRGSVPFTVVKLALVSGGVGILWRYRHHPMSLAGAAFTCGCYLLLMVHHVQSVEALAWWAAAGS